MYAHGDFFYFYLFFSSINPPFSLLFLSLSSLFVCLFLRISYAGPFEPRLIGVDGAALRKGMALTYVGRTCSPTPLFVLLLVQRAKKYVYTIHYERTTVNRTFLDRKFDDWFLTLEAFRALSLHARELLFILLLQCNYIVLTGARTGKLPVLISP